MEFDYFYGPEDAEQYQFYRIPKLLITSDQFKDVSVEAKLLYGLMLDRLSLSIKNGWFDALNRAYIIYTIEDVSEDMHCGSQKAVKLVAELEKKAGLIKKKRQGLGKPSLIYVLKFSTVSPQNSSESQFLNCENHNSGMMNITTQEFRESQTNKNNHNKTEINKTNPIFLIWTCISSSKYGKKNCPESKGIPEEVLMSAFVESFRIITDDRKDVLEEFLTRTEEALNSTGTRQEIERVKKELDHLETKQKKLLDLHLDSKIDFGTYQDKKAELTKEQQLKTTELLQLQGNAGAEKDLHKRIDAMRKLLTDAPILKEFDRNVFESIVEKVIVGGYDDDGNADPYMITFVYKTGFEDKKNGEDFKPPRRNATKRKLLQLPSDEVASLEQQSCDDARRDCLFTNT